MMSLAVYEETERDIDQAYTEQNKAKIEKETSFVLSQMIIFMMAAFKDRLKSITFNTHDLSFDEAFITSEENREALLNWLKRMIQLQDPIDDVDFGKLKVDLEQWFYQIGGKGIYFDYNDEYLLRPGETAEKLGISTVTLNKYIKQGFECADTNSHNKIPKHMIPLWKDPVYAIKVQMLFQERKLRIQPPEERLKEIFEELLEFQMKYKTNTSKEAFSRIEGNSMDGLTDYYEWESLEEEKELLMINVIGEKGNG